MTAIRWFGVVAAAAMLLEGVATAGQAAPGPGGPRRAANPPASAWD